MNTLSRQTCDGPAALSRLRDERGVTVVEVLVAAILLVIGSLATLGLVSAAERQGYRAEQSQVVADRLQAELEAIKKLEWARIALTSAPATSGDPRNPNYRVSTAAGVPMFALNRNGTNSVPLAVNGYDGVTTGVVAPGPTPFSTADTGGSGDVAGNIYRYVSWLNDPACPENLCPGAKDLKRVTVAILLNTTASGGQRTYQQIQSDVIDGGVRQEAGQSPTTPATAEAVRYYLSDTPCNLSARATPSSHPARNTLGSCSAGPQSGPTPGAPDRLFKTPTPNGSGFQNDYDLSTDVVTQAPSDTGLQVPVQPKECDYAPSRSNAHLQVHRWLTGPVTASTDFVLDGSGTLSVWSRTINNAQHSGKLCVWLFTRERTNTGGEADNLVTDFQTGTTWFNFTDPSWSWNAWKQYSIPLTFEDLRIKPGDRLGLAIAVDAAGTPGEALQFNYNHPNFDSSLVVYTTTKTTAPD